MMIGRFRSMVIAALHNVPVVSSRGGPLDDDAFISTGALGGFRGGDKIGPDGNRGVVLRKHFHQFFVVEYLHHRFAGGRIGGDVRHHSQHISIFLTLYRGRCDLYEHVGFLLFFAVHR